MSKKISLEAARVLVGLSQREAAEKFGVHPQTVASWENDSSKVKQKYVQMIPEIYLVNPTDIFFGTKNEFTRYYEEKHGETI
ncbi:helix-turn-helix transcriptional regulator [Enterococcus avium]|uniref:helix-turn-helix domain-containing protein n=1 Tax=Enterococcus avium TaxID=33945 RepID=UPI00288FF78C|nr:helix-turn-helix transcriptional regulator [Enterococcus avium]MDT2500287.1 helix-turn-helix transcriptional regulator [Enterococcus avium]